MSIPEAAAGRPGDLAARAYEEEQFGRWEAAARLYALSFRRAVLDGQVEQAADSLRGQARVLIQEERFDEAEELVELSREMAGRAGLTRSVGRAVNVLGIIRYHRRDWAGAREHYRRALEFALDVGDDDLAGLALQNAGVIAYVLGDLREARSLYLESIGSFVRSGNTGNALLAYNNLGIASADLKEWLEAEIYYTRGIELAERQSQSGMLAKLYGNRAEPLIQIGEIPAAVETLRKAQAAAEAVGDRLAVMEVERWRSRIARLEGDFEAAERHIARALELATGPSLERAAALRELGSLRQAHGRVDEAHEAYLRSEELYASLGAEAHAREVGRRLADLATQSLPEPVESYGVG
ncbi:MAG TPA: tetratricopeptide repeat protein [Longimicrobium sp.]|jgi:tetratricopeptide (TPR) repeat protein